MRIYIVECNAIKGDQLWDALSGVFSTQEEAVKCAETEWSYFTEKEKSSRVISVMYADVDVPAGTDLRTAYNVAMDTNVGCYGVKDRAL